MRIKVVGNATHILAFLCYKMQEPTFTINVEPVCWERVALDLLTSLITGSELPDYLTMPFVREVHEPQCVVYDGFSAPPPSPELLTIWAPLVQAIVVHAPKVFKWLVREIIDDGFCLLPVPRAAFGTEASVQHVRYMLSVHPTRPFQLVKLTGLEPRWVFSNNVDARKISELVPS